MIPPGGDPGPASPDRVQVSPIVNPGGPSVSRTFTTNGAWTFYCSLHASYTGGAVGRHGGHGRRDRGRHPDAPTGVDYTEYRVKTGATQGDWVRTANTGGASPFASQVTISAEGQHTVEYRSVDKAGNAETAKTVDFGIDIPDPGFPVIQAFADPTSGTAPLLVRFSATGFDPDGGAAVLQVGVRRRLGPRPRRRAHVHQAGTYAAKVTATDDEGDKTSQEVTVIVACAGHRAADGGRPPRTSTTAGAGGAVKFAPHGDDPDGPESDLLYTWDFGDGVTRSSRTRRHTYNAPGTYTAKVTVSDDTAPRRRETIDDHGHRPAGQPAPPIRRGGRCRCPAPPR